jgi:hypothetical protein
MDLRREVKSLPLVLSDCWFDRELLGNKDPMALVAARGFVRVKRLRIVVGPVV